nr:unnamed protein product [Spirometra erinaceieuropaei]
MKVFLFGILLILPFVFFDSAVGNSTDASSTAASSDTASSSVSAGGVDSSDSTDDGSITTSGVSAFSTAHFYLIPLLLALSAKLC